LTPPIEWATLWPQRVSPVTPCMETHPERHLHIGE
jgi:hypothetical protein